jgi:hypothetical protein
MNSHRVAGYWRDIRGLAWQWPWRLAVTLQYAALFALPILAAHFWALQRRGRIRQKSLLLSGAVVAAGTLAGATLGYARVWMPIVGWNLSVLLDLGDGTVVAATVLAGVGGIAAGHVLLARIDEFRALSAEKRLLDLFVLCSFGLTLIYVQFGDEYLLVYLPYLAVLSARSLPVSRQAVFALLASMAVSSFVASDWTRRLLLRAEVPWQLGEAAVARGVPPSCVSGSGGWQWMAYHSMDDFVSRYDPAAESPRGFWLFWSEWIPHRKANALAFYGPIPATADNSIPGTPVITASLPGQPPQSFGLWIVEPDSAEWSRRIAVCAPGGASRPEQALRSAGASHGGGGS